MQRLDGVIRIVQESRFQLVDDEALLIIFCLDTVRRWSRNSSRPCWKGGSVCATPIRRT